MVVFSLRRWSSYVPSRFLVSRRTLELPMPWIRFAYGDFTLFVLLFQNSSASHPTCNVGVLYPVRIATYGLGSSDFARHYFRNRSFFLFLQVLRCFSSLGSPRKTMDSSYGDRLFTCRVPPFGYLRIGACLRLPVAFRSLPRPSSAYGARASTLCSL